MKKRYRIGICLVLTVCLLLLSACAGGQTPHTDDPAQSTGQNENNDTLGQGHEEETGQQQNTEQQAGEKADGLVWHTNTVEISNYSMLWLRLYEASNAKDSYTENGNQQNIHRMNYATWRDWSGYLLEQHSSCAEEGRCIYWKQQTQSPCATLALFQNAKYNEDYFKENTLLVLDIVNNGRDVPFAFKELRYADHSLTCVVERQISFWGDGQAYPQCIFVEIDSVLPADTELTLEMNEYNDPRLNKLPKTIDFQWKSKLVRKDLFFTEEIGAKYKDSIYGSRYPNSEDKFMGKACMLVDYETYEKLKADAEQLKLTAFDGRSYTKEFFENNSLVLFNIHASTLRFEGLKDVRYQNGILTCYYQYETVKEGELVIGEITDDYLHFIEVDTVLPEEIEIRTELIPT